MLVGARNFFFLCCSFSENHATAILQSSIQSCNMCMVASIWIQQGPVERCLKHHLLATELIVASSPLTTWSVKASAPCNTKSPTLIGQAGLAQCRCRSGLAQRARSSHTRMGFKLDLWPWIKGSESVGHTQMWMPPQRFRGKKRLNH